MINFGLLRQSPDPMSEFVKGSALMGELKRSQNTYNVQNALYELSQKPQPTYEDYQTLMSQYPQLSEVVQAPMQNITEERRRVAEQRYAPVIAALNNGNAGVASRLLDDVATSYDNSGDQENAQAARTMVNLMKVDPNIARTSMNLIGMSTFPNLMKGQLAQAESAAKIGQFNAQAARDFEAANKTNVEAQYVPAEKQANINQSQASAEASRAQADKSRIEAALAPREFDLRTQQEANKAALDRFKAGELSEPAIKFVNEATNNASQAGRSAQKAASLYNQFNDYANKGYTSIDSIMANVADKARYKDELKAVIDEATLLKNSEAVKNIPKPASDTDLAFALEGLPRSNDSPQTWARYMRGLEQANRWAETYSTAQAQWAGANRGALTPLANDTVIDGIKVPAGADFNKFVVKLHELKNRKTASNQLMQQGE